MASSLEDSEATRPGRRLRRTRWRWLVAGSFVLGVVVGVLLVGLLRLGNPEFPSATAPSATLVPSGSATASSSTTVGGGAEAQVNASCLRVIEEAQQVYDIITGVREAAADVDLRKLDEIVRQLQPIQTRLGSDLSECKVDTSVSRAPAESQTSPQVTPTR